MKALKLGKPWMAFDLPAGGKRLRPMLTLATAGLDAVHDSSTSFGALMEPDALAEMQQRYPAVRHPIVRTHPDTGRQYTIIEPQIGGWGASQTKGGSLQGQFEAHLAVLLAYLAVAGDENPGRIQATVGQQGVLDRRGARLHRVDDLRVAGIRRRRSARISWQAHGWNAELHFHAGRGCRAEPRCEQDESLHPDALHAGLEVLTKLGEHFFRTVAGTDDFKIGRAHV